MEYSVQFLKHWTSKQQDITFKVLIEGWLFGIQFSEDVKVDINFFRDIIMKEYDKNNFNEHLQLYSPKMFKIIENMNRFIKGDTPTGLSLIHI